jgi:hypothetical protein
VIREANRKPGSQKGSQRRQAPGDAVWDRTTAHNKLRSHLREYFPGFLAAFPARAGILRPEARTILARVAELDASDVGVASRDGPEGVGGIVDDFCHGLDEAVECRRWKAVHLFQCSAAQFGAVDHRRSRAAAARSIQSGIASVTGTVVTVPARAAASSS